MSPEARQFNPTNEEQPASLKCPSWESDKLRSLRSSLCDLTHWGRRVGSVFASGRCLPVKDLRWTLLCCRLFFDFFEIKSRTIRSRFGGPRRPADTERFPRGGCRVPPFSLLSHRKAAPPSSGFHSSDRLRKFLSHHDSSASAHNALILNILFFCPSSSWVCSELHVWLREHLQTPLFLTSKYQRVFWSFLRGAAAIRFSRRKFIFWRARSRCTGSAVNQEKSQVNLCFFKRKKIKTLLRSFLFFYQASKFTLYIYIMGYNSLVRVLFLACY